MNEKLQKIKDNFKKNYLVYSIILTLFLIIIILSAFIFIRSAIFNYISEKKQIELEVKNKEISLYEELLWNANNIDWCNKIIDVFSKDYLNNFKDYLPNAKIEDKIKYCNDNILTNISTFSTWVFFNPENNFLSTVNINFSKTFYEDIWQVNSDEFVNNRIKAKQKLLSLINIEPKIDLNIDDIVFYPNKAILYLKFKELTNYKISLKDFSFENKVKLKSEPISFKTPESKFLKLNIENPVSLYRDITPPKFSLVEYKSNLTEITAKICRVENEVYAKIETLRSLRSQPESKDFFINWIDKIKTLECKTKIVSIKKENNNFKTFFDFDDVIWNPARSWLYFVTFEDKKLRNFNNTIQSPLFFGVIDSHLTMKISKSWQWFFFVNDFDWNPLANQNIRAYINDFQAFKINRDDKLKDNITTYFTVLDKNIFSKEIILWKTDKNWILKFNLDDKIKNAFDLTFEDWWQTDSEWKYSSIFITSASDKYLTYNNSRWNAWIAPFNFWYKSEYYYNNDQDDKLELNKWQDYPKYLTHTYSDRILYLPWEEVNIKSIIRDMNLKIASLKNFNIKINNPKWEEVLSANLKSNDFWSIFTKYNIPIDAKLWSYYVYVLDGDKEIWDTSFSVEIFQNPKFKNEITLKTDWLDWDFFKVTESIKTNNRDTDYSWNFSIKANIISSYYNGAKLKNANISYKVYKQYHYDFSYWDDCYYWCYYEPQKEFYTEWVAVTDENWFASFDININHKTSYDDYKYIVEATVVDEVWDKISSANSIVVKLPKEYKTRDSNSSISLKTGERFYKSWDKINIQVWLSWNIPWSNWFNDKYLLIIKKKEYKTEFINDVKWDKRPINSFKENIIDKIIINSKNWKIVDWKLNIDYKIDWIWEYVFEYWKINIEDKDKKDELVNKSYFSVVLYWDINATNPIIDDNKVQILSNKISYKIWEKARFLIRLPVSKWKILWTIEKFWVEKHEYIDIKSNTFFKEIIVDDSFLPNAYISAVLIDTQNILPEYKVWYTEIVVDKTDKKSFIDIKTDKKEYVPREEVKIDLVVKDKNGKWISSEVSLMVIDDSLISLMWNIDLNLIDKFFKKLPFQIQTSLTNVVMLSNYYFSRPWIVGWSWFGSFKWWDSAVSTRNIFKNTAYYNPNIITDSNWKASIKFNLPDNLTNFRIIAISNSKNNFFGAQEKFINVRKNVIVEPKTPIILRDKDQIKISTNIFNTTTKEIWFKVNMSSEDLNIKNPSIDIKIPASSSKTVSFDIENKNTLKQNLTYLISALGDSVDNSDKFEWIIKLVNDPIMLSYTNKSFILDKDNSNIVTKITMPDNIDLEKSTIEIRASNNKIAWVEKIVSSLAVYPYWCIEQTTSSTIPNVVLKNFNSIFSWIAKKEDIDKNINAWIDRIISMQTEKWWFSYWQWEIEPNLQITPYVVRSLIDIQNLWETKVNTVIKNSVAYLESNISNTTDNLTFSEIIWALAKAKSKNIDTNKIITLLNNKDLDFHTRLASTYSLVILDKNKFKSEINKNIDILKLNLKTNNWSNRYRDNNSDKSIFTSMLIDFNYDKKYIDILIDELYQIDWMSYYYSTQSKNNAFISFYKYLQAYWVNNSVQLNYLLGNDKNQISLWEENPAIYKKELSAKDFLVWNNFEIKTEFDSWNMAYLEISLKKYPKDITKVKPYANKIKVSREIYEVTWSQEIKITNNVFKKWKLYRIILNLETNDNKQLRNLVIEDYQSTWLKAINERLKINSNVADDRDNRYFDYKEIRPEVVFLNSSYNYWKLNYTYLLRAEYAWKFTLPPVSAYLMYEPETRAYSEYNIIEVVE